jgi:hypothetical protein
MKNNRIRTKTMKIIVNKNNENNSKIIAIMIIINYIKKMIIVEIK